jgi:hypothetical protein
MYLCIYAHDYVSRIREIHGAGNGRQMPGRELDRYSLSLVSTALSAYWPRSIVFATWILRSSPRHLRSVFGLLGVGSYAVDKYRPSLQCAQQSERNCSRSEAVPNRRLSGQEPHVVTVTLLATSLQPALGIRVKTRASCCSALLKSAVVQAPASHQLPIRR